MGRDWPVMSTNHPGAIERTLRVADDTPGITGRHICGKAVHRQGGPLPTAAARGCGFNHHVRKGKQMACSCGFALTRPDESWRMAREELYAAGALPAGHVCLIHGGSALGGSSCGPRARSMPL